MQQHTALTTLRKVIFTLLMIGNVIFIFYNSSQIGSVSSGISLNVLEIVNPILTRLGLPTVTHTVLRKLGHFGEYALLGMWSLLALRVYTRRVIAFVSWPLLLGLFIAVCDEFYQSFIPGRTSAVSDVLIDFAGVVAGLGLAMVVVLTCHGIAAIIRAIARRLRRK